MGAWETDDEYRRGLAATSLPTPQDTPYRNPSRTLRKSRRSITPPGQGTSLPPMPSEKGSKRSSRDTTTDETISILDPRRFTPTLHANLVSEILTLRRDQEEKLRQIESLETALHITREEREMLQENLVKIGKESRSLKRQLSLLEGGTSSALGELARERDDAVESVSDVKKRLEAAQKKIRNQDDDSQRVHDLLAHEKDNWEEEKRKYERKMHVAESRLKLVLDEVAAYQAAHAQNAGAGHGHESEIEESGRENDAASVRTMNITNSVRFSLIHGPGFMKLNGHSLADELNFDDEDEQSDIDGRESALSNHNPYAHARNVSQESVINRLHHHRNQSLESLKRSGSVVRGRLFMNQSVLEALEGEDEEFQPPVPKVSYTDTGIQFFPPPSPKLPVSKPMTPEPSLSWGKSPEVECSPHGDGEIEANQRRKRVHIARPLSIEPVSPRKLMVSTSSQTIEEPPLIPPKIPRSPIRPSLPPPPPNVKKPSMMTSSTQTDTASPAHTFQFPPMPPSAPPIEIPSISFNPPTSRPTSPQKPRLPQYFKDFGCQVSLSSPVTTSEAEVQTEGIQTDKRLAMLPPHLQPSTITSRPSSPNLPSAIKNFTPVPGNVPPRNPRRLANRRDTPEMPSSPVSIADSDMTHDTYPRNNDDSPLSSQKASMRRSHRFSSLFAEFDGGSSDEGDKFGDVDLSDSEYRTALSAPPRPKSIPSRPGKRSLNGTTTTNGTIPTSSEQITVRQVSRGSLKPFANELYNFFSGDKDSSGRIPSSAKSGRPFEKSPAATSSNRASVLRKAAMFQNGIVSHQGRSRGPSISDAKNPPFPIPTRASSRKLPFSSSAPSDGQRSPTRGETFFCRGTGRSRYRAGSIRKVRSAAALPRSQRRRRQGSRSPPPLSPSTEAPESPKIPPLPRNDITTPRNRPRGSDQFRYLHQLSVNTANTANKDNTMSTDPPFVSNGAQSNSVVDAIAQTMVGEWMFKYVRRRKSFGVPESNSKYENSNDRHKRWVWLAPYERAILWSSKQPSSGSAMMGKTGRKRKRLALTHQVLEPLTKSVTIRSVLDVKDDNACPKGSAPLFNRSILIFTPQRALKFTATSEARHYIWLTALSFLAHPSQAVSEIISAPPLREQPALLPEFELRRTRLKRPGIRDSICLAKGRTHVPKAATPSVPSIPSALSSQMGDVIPFPMLDSVGDISSNHSRDDSADATEPPFILRFHERNNQPMAYGPKRSNTGGHVPPPLSFRGFSGPAGGVHRASTNSTAGASIGTAGSSDIYQSQAWSTGTCPTSQAISQRTSEVSSRPSNFFDAIGTVRMEAFISPLAPPGFGDFPNEQNEFRHKVRRRSKELRRRQSQSRHQDSYNSRGACGTDDTIMGAEPQVRKTSSETNHSRGSSL